jgi:hypothetical protein
MSASVQPAAIDRAPLAPAPMPHFRVRSFGLTDRGRVREHNQDQFLV